MPWLFQDPQSEGQAKCVGTSVSADRPPNQPPTEPRKCNATRRNVTQVRNVGDRHHADAKPAGSLVLALGALDLCCGLWCSTSDTYLALLKGEGGDSSFYFYYFFSFSGGREIGSGSVDFTYVGSLVR